MNELKAVLAAFLAGQAEFAQVDAVLVRSLHGDPTIAPSAFAAIDQIYRTGRLPLQLYVLLKNRIAQSHAAARAQAPPSSSTPPPSAPAAPPAPAPPPPPQDRTIFNPSAAAPSPAASPAQTSPPAMHTAPPPRPAPPPPPPPRVVAEPPAARATEPEAPPADRTIMRGRPPPRAPGLSQPHGGAQRSFEGEPEAAGPAGPVTGPAASPTGPFDLGHSTGPSETSHTGGANTGRTSNTGTGTTGTGKTGTGSSSWTDPAKWEERPQVALERGSVLKGRFVLENVVGRGGMGVVFRAKDLRKEEAQDRDPYVAVKILNDEFRRHPESLKALQREARKSQQLAHPNIVSVFDFDRDGGTVYMTMEFLEGEPLDKIIKNPQFEGMALGEAYPLVRGLGSALSYAHDKGIVHSDFKPGNCFLTKSGVIKVFDFGIAQAAKLKGSDLQGEETKFDAGSLGALTPAYASCEMIAGEQPDTRDDIYALGCVVYELLTGKHPFSKKSAADARDQKLVPAPIKRLTRRQWRAIEKSLAFRRADRTASVWELVDGLAKQQLFSAPRIAVGAAAIVVIGVGAYFGVSAWQQAQHDRLVEALTSRDDARVMPALQRLGQLEAVERITVVQEVSAPLLDWYIARIDTSVDEKRQRYDFPGAAALVTEAKAWFPDSARLTTRETMLDSRKNELLQELDQKFTANLQAGRLLEDPQGEDIVDVLGIVSQVEPGHKLLSDPRLSFAYVEQASEALKRADAVRARPLIDAGLARYPANAQLTDLRDNLTAMLGEQEKAQRLAALQTELGRAAGLRTLADLRGLESSVRELATLAPDDPALRAYRGRVATALDTELQGPLGERDWDAAQQRIADVGALLAPEQQRDAQGRVTAARTDYEGKRDAIFARLNRTVADGRLNDAPAVLRDLDTLRADAATKAQARGIVVQGYASDAQRLAGAGQLPQAITRVRAGLEFESGSPELTALLETLSTQDQVAKEQGATEAKRRRDEEAAGLRNSINAALTQPTLTLAAAKDTLAQMSRLAALADADPLATNGREQVAQKLAKQSTDAGNAGQSWDQVVAQLDQALGLIAGSPTLQSARAGAQANVESARQGERVARGAQLQQAVDALLAAPRYDAAWVKDVRDQLASMNGLVPEAEIAQRQQRAAELLIARGAERRGQERFAEANTALGLAATLTPRLASLVAEQAQLKDAMDASARATGAARQAADIEALKSSFMTSVNANSTKEANDKLTELRAKLPANDPFLTTTAPQALADVSLRLARARVAEQDYDRAEQLIAQGLALWPKSEPLQALSADVRAARDQRLTKNVADLRAQLDRGAGDANDGKRLLTQIRSDAGAGFGALERDLTARAETHIGANAADDAYRVYAGMIFGREFARPAGAAPPSAPPAAPATSTGGAAAATTPPPRVPVGGRPCTTSMAAQGRRAQAVCYDTFGASIKGPDLVVAPPGGGSAAAFAIGRTELKVANWNDYCKASGKCAERPNPTNPVTNVSAADAQDYAAWLTQQTGFTYRLPTRDEWVYVASAPRQNPKNFNCINPTNGKGGKLLEIGESGNDWGVVDYLGNVQEWVKAGPGFEARGGHYDMQLAQCTADRADARTAGAGDEHTGLRLVREIPGG